MASDLRYVFDVTVFDQAGNSEPCQHVQTVSVNEMGVPAMWEVADTYKRIQERESPELTVMIDHPLGYPILLPGTRAISPPSATEPTHSRCPHCSGVSPTFVSLEFKVLYFKPSGKYYDEGKFIHEVSWINSAPRMREAANAILTMQQNGQAVPGLCSDGKFFHIVIEHPLHCPVLLPIRATE